jgi:hypothetical protein
VWHNLKTEVGVATHSEIIERAREEWQRKRSDRDWRGWLRIAAGLEIGRDEVDKRLHNRVGVPGGGRKGRNKGRPWNEAFSLWLNENGMGDMAGKRFGQLRSRLMDCIDCKAAIEEWRKGLSADQKLAWNHPVTVWAHFAKHRAAEEEAARVAAGGEPIAKAPSPLTKANEAIRNLIDENDRLKKAPRESAEIFIEVHGADEAKRFADEILAIINPPVAEPPARQRKLDGRAANGRNREKYHFGSFAVGESRIVPGDPGNITSASKTYGRTHGMKFATRKAPDGREVKRMA